MLCDVAGQRGECDVCHLSGRCRKAGFRGRDGVLFSILNIYKLEQETHLLDLPLCMLLFLNILLYKGTNDHQNCCIIF